LRLQTLYTPYTREGKPERKRPLGRLKHKWEDNIKINIREMGWEVGDDSSAVDSDQWRDLVNTVINHPVA
jgi:hypothetical protein